MSIIAIRGATTTEKNTKEEISRASLELYDNILTVNNLSKEDIIYIHITSTEDITEYYPATALRLNGCESPLFSSLEPKIKNSMPLCIRMLFLINGELSPKNVYLKDTIRLLQQKEEK